MRYKLGNFKNAYGTNNVIFNDTEYNSNLMILGDFNQSNDKFKDVCLNITDDGGTVVLFDYYPFTEHNTLSFKEMTKKYKINYINPMAGDKITLPFDVFEGISSATFFKSLIFDANSDFNKRQFDVFRKAVDSCYDESGIIDTEEIFKKMKSIDASIENYWSNSQLLIEHGIIKEGDLCIKSGCINVIRIDLYSKVYLTLATVLMYYLTRLYEGCKDKYRNKFFKDGNEFFIGTDNYQIFDINTRSNLISNLSRYSNHSKVNFIVYQSSFNRKTFVNFERFKENLAFLVGCNSGRVEIADAITNSDRKVEDIRNLLRYHTRDQFLFRGTCVMDNDAVIELYYTELIISGDE